MGLTALLIPGLRITGIFGALLTVIALAFVNAKAWDAALFFQIPNEFSMRVLLLFLTNGILFWIIVKLLPGIEVNGLMPALAAPVIFTVCSLILAEYAAYIDWVEILNFVINLLEGIKDFFQQASPEVAAPPSSIPPGP